MSDTAQQHELTERLEATAANLDPADHEEAKILANLNQEERYMIFAEALATIRAYRAGLQHAHSGPVSNGQHEERCTEAAHAMDYLFNGRLLDGYADTLRALTEPQDSPLRRA